MNIKKIALFCCKDKNRKVRYQYEKIPNNFELKNLINNKNLKLKIYNYGKNQPYQDSNRPNDGNFIYFLLEKQENCYIGVTSNLRARIQNHKKDKNFDKIYFIYFNRIIPRSYVESLEYFLIKIKNPKYNKQYCN